jgi:hypothetical protein
MFMRCDEAARVLRDKSDTKKSRFADVHRQHVGASAMNESWSLSHGERRDFGYLSTGHAAAFDWNVAAPSWISSFVPNLEAEFGLALMFASMIPICWRAGRKRG